MALDIRRRLRFKAVNPSARGIAGWAMLQRPISQRHVNPPVNGVGGLLMRRAFSCVRMCKTERGDTVNVSAHEPGYALCVGASRA